MDMDRQTSAIKDHHGTTVLVQNIPELPAGGSEPIQRI
jgi:hypothetical protein